MSHCRATELTKMFNDEADKQWWFMAKNQNKVSDVGHVLDSWRIGISPWIELSEKRVSDQCECIKNVSRVNYSWPRFFHLKATMDRISESTYQQCMPSIRIIIRAIWTCCLLFYHCPLPGQGLGPLNETKADDEASYGYNETSWTYPMRSMLILIPDSMVLILCMAYMLLARAWLSFRQPKQVTSSRRLRHWNPQRSLFQKVSSFTIDTGRGKGEQREKDNIFLGYGDYSSWYI